MTGDPSSYDLEQVTKRIGALTARFDRLEQTVGGHASALDSIEELAENLSARLNAQLDPSPIDAPAIDINVLGRWVHDNVAQLVERKVRGRVDTGPHWCPQWWRHPEAVIRFEGLRRAWVTLVADDGIGLITYLGYLDQTLTSLMADAGPFHAGSCKHGRHVGVEIVGDHPHADRATGVDDW